MSIGWAFKLGYHFEQVCSNSPTEFTSEELFRNEIAAKKAKRDAGYHKVDKPSEYTKFHQGIRTGPNENKPSYIAGYQVLELDKARSKSANMRSAALLWKERGPGNVPGRTRGVLVLPNDATHNTWLAGSVAGGIWKTTNGGLNWDWKTPGIPNMAATSFAMSASNPLVIYAGTGESFAGYNATNGNGIYKSLDGGESWQQITSTLDDKIFGSINRMVVDNTNADKIIALTSPGYWDGQRTSHIMLSEDGGLTWVKVYSDNNKIDDILFHSSNFSTLYASIDGQGVVKSSDGGKTWKSSSEGLIAAGRIELAIAPTNPSVVYASVEGGPTGAGSDLFVSKDGAETWTVVFDAATGSGIDILGGQGYYDNAIAVNPYNENEVYVAGVNMFKVTVGSDGDTAPSLQGVVENNTQSFLEFVSFGQPYFGGQMGAGNASQYANVEIRFGNGASQLAHRFTVPKTAGRNGDGGAGVPASSYIYQNYVSVLFEVWDVTNNRQLMVSFRDQERNGHFNLNDRNFSDDNLLDNREYLYIHNVEYAQVPSSSISKSGGQEYQYMYMFWPTLAAGKSWDEDNLPVSNLEIVYGSLSGKASAFKSVCDAYGNFNGPNGFSQITNQTKVSGVHPDHHNLIMVPVSETDKTFKIINANDGGIYVSNISVSPGVRDGDWYFAGQGYNTSQFYGIDKKPGEDVYIGGTQDNGTWRTANNEEASAESMYLRALGGDGFDVVWNYNDPNMILGCVYYNQIYRSTNGGTSWGGATSGLRDVGEGAGPFITKLANSKINPNTVFAVGAQGVWRTSNFGTSWTLAPISDGWILNSFSDVTISAANTDIVWAGSGMYSNGASGLHVSTDGGTSFNRVSTYNTEAMGVITGIATHPTEPNTAYALFSYSGSPKVLKTTDLGDTWADISGFEGRDESANGFPDVAIYSLLVMPYNPNIIWVGTEIGLVESIDGGKNWHLANNGFPNVSIWDMKIVDQQVVIGTHGRGIWSVTMPEIEGVVRKPHIQSAHIRPDGKINLVANLKYSYDSYKVIIGTTVVATVQNKPSAYSTIVINNNDFEGSAAYIVATHNGVEYKSNSINIASSSKPIAVDAYQSQFSESNSDFSGANFSIATRDNIESSSLHSRHSYSANADYSYMLKVPIIISEGESIFEYDEVAIVAAGDYVVVEATTDGLNWSPIVMPYNASVYPQWEAYINSANKPDASDMKHREIDLHQFYNAGETVLFRFRLVSNASINSYGWVIDNLSIQNSAPLGFDDLVADNKLGILAYPNPATDQMVQLKYYLPNADYVIIKVMTTEGKLILTKKLGYSMPGEHVVSPQEFNKFASGHYIVEIKAGDLRQRIHFIKQ